MDTVALRYVYSIRQHLPTVLAPLLVEFKHELADVRKVRVWCYLCALYVCIALFVCLCACACVSVYV